MSEISPFEVFSVLQGVFGTEPGYREVEAEKRKQARRCLAKACELLAQQRFKEARIHFTLSNMLNRNLLISLSNAKRRKLKSFLTENGGEFHAPELWKQLSRLDSLPRIELIKLRLRYRLYRLYEFWFGPRA